MLGDTIRDALAAVGVTESRVSKWLGRPCGCSERREKMNTLDAWARRVLGGKVEKALDYLARVLSDG